MGKEEVIVFFAKEKTISLGPSPLQMTVLFRKALHGAAPSTVWAQHRELGLGWSSASRGNGAVSLQPFQPGGPTVVVRYKRQGGECMGLQLPKALSQPQT